MYNKAFNKDFLDWEFEDLNLDNPENIQEAPPEDDFHQRANDDHEKLNDYLESSFDHNNSD
ncbi:MAG: hypothetical protein PHQ86_05785 [Dehalococcoidales bacterium]|nr:hypothetical protein [Dehalococcoidales bacterium]